MSDKGCFDELGKSVDALIRGEPLTEDQIRQARRDYWREQPMHHRAQVFVIRSLQRVCRYWPAWVMCGLAGVALLFT